MSQVQPYLTSSKARGIMSKDQLIEVAKQNLAHAQAGTIQQTPDFL